jgi:hypothetical protein
MAGMSSEMRESQRGDQRSVQGGVELELELEPELSRTSSFTASQKCVFSTDTVMDNASSEASDIPRTCLIHTIVTALDSASLPIPSTVLNSNHTLPTRLSSSISSSTPIDVKHSTPKSLSIFLRLTVKEALRPKSLDLKEDEMVMSLKPFACSLNAQGTERNVRGQFYSISRHIHLLSESQVDDMGATFDVSEHAYSSGSVSWGTTYITSPARNTPALDSNSKPLVLLLAVAGPNDDDVRDRRHHTHA